MITTYQNERQNRNRMSWPKRPSVYVTKFLLFFIILVNDVNLTSQKARKEPPPVLTQIPKTDFSCKGRHPGYYADVDVECQVYHMCDILEKQYSYLCPGYTLFNQKFMVCDHWHSVDCSRTESYYHLNLNIGKVPPKKESNSNSINRTQRKHKRTNTSKQSKAKPLKNKLISNTSRLRKKKNSQSTTLKPRTTTKRTQIPRSFRPTSKPNQSPRRFITTTPRTTPRRFITTTPRTTPRRFITTTPRTTPRRFITTTPRTTPRRFITTTPRTTPRRFITTTPRTTPRRFITTTPRTTPRRFITTTPKTTPRRFITTTPRTTPRRFIATPRTTPRRFITTTPRTTPRRFITTTPRTTPRRFKTTTVRSTPKIFASTSKSTSPSFFLSPPRRSGDTIKKETNSLFNSISGRGGGSRIKFDFNSQEEDRNLTTIKFRPLLKRKRISLTDQRNFTIPASVFTTTQSPLFMEVTSFENSDEDISLNVDSLSTFLIPPFKTNPQVIPQQLQFVSPFLLPPARGPIILRGEKQELRTPLVLSTRIELPSKNTLPFTQSSFTPTRLSFVRGNRAFFIPSAGLTPPIDTNSIEEDSFFHQNIENHMTMIFPQRMALRKRRPLKVNPNCPQCHPVFLRPGECQPCVIIK